MNTQQKFVFATAAIIFVGLQPVIASGQGASAAGNLHHARGVQASAEVANGASQEANAQTVMSKLLPEFPGKEVVMLTVTYPPAHSGAVHRHNADVFVYVLEGSLVMGVKGGEPITLGPGQTFYEGPNDVHTVGRNASKTRPAEFLVFLIKDKDAPISIPAE